MKTIFQILAEKSGDELASKSELAELRALQETWEVCRNTMNTHTADAAYIAWTEHQTSLGNAARKGTIKNEEAWSRLDFERDFEAKGAAAREEMRKLSLEARPIARTIVERFCQEVNRIATELESAEAKQFAEFGLNYSPSLLVQTVRRVPELARRRVPDSEYAQSSPADMLPFLIEIYE